jgi:uncharacterized membrane protein
MDGIEQPQRRWSALRLFAMGVVLGLVALVTGIVLGIRSYDERFIYDNTNSFWDVVSWLSFALTMIGLLAVVTSIVGIVVVAVGRLARRASAGASRRR